MNAAFPALVVHSSFMTGQVTLAICARMLLLTMALTGVAKLVFEGAETKQWYSRGRGLATVGKLHLELYLYGFCLGKKQPCPGQIC